MAANPKGEDVGADIYSMFIKAVNSGGLYVGIFQEEIALTFLQEMETAAFNCFSDFYNYLVKNGYSQAEIEKYLPVGLDLIKGWDDEEQENETNKALAEYKDVVSLYTGTSCVYAREVYKHIKPRDKISIKVPKFKEFYCHYLKRLARDPFVRSPAYFRGSKIVERKLVHMDALRATLENCVRGGIQVKESTDSGTPSVPSTPTPSPSPYPRHVAMGKVGRIEDHDEGDIRPEDSASNPPTPHKVTSVLPTELHKALSTPPSTVRPYRSVFTQEVQKPQPAPPVQATPQPPIPPTPKPPTPSPAVKKTPEPVSAGFDLLPSPTQEFSDTNNGAQGVSGTSTPNVANMLSGMSGVVQTNGPSGMSTPNETNSVNGPSPMNPLLPVRNPQPRPQVQTPQTQAMEQPQAPRQVSFQQPANNFPYPSFQRPSVPSFQPHSYGKQRGNDDEVKTITVRQQVVDVPTKERAIKGKPIPEEDDDDVHLSLPQGLGALFGMGQGYQQGQQQQRNQQFQYGNMPKGDEQWLDEDSLSGTPSSFGTPGDMQ